MITVEVIISLLILFMVIATSSVTIKQLFLINKQQSNHENLYIELLNVKDYIDEEVCQKDQDISGDLNGFHFVATCQKVNELKSFVKDEDREGNLGNYLITLYKVTLSLQKENIDKKYQYYKTVVRHL